MGRCIPNKTLLRHARIAHETGIAVDFPQVMNRVRQVRQSIYEDADAPPHMEKLGVEVVIASASFVDAHTVHAADEAGKVRRLTSRFFIIATGSRPRLPGFSETPLT